MRTLARSSTSLFILVGISVALTSALALFSSSRVAASGPEPTPTPGVLEPPAAPTKLAFVSTLEAPFTGVTWSDNSENEDGFRILKSVGGQTAIVAATLPASATEAPIPAGTLAEQCAGVRFTVIAFNAAGDSAPSNEILLPKPLCDLPKGVIPPPLGTGPAGGGSAGVWPWAVAALGLTLVALGGGAWLGPRAFAEKRKPEWRGR